jgi:hypothetical protein
VFPNIHVSYNFMTSLYFWRPTSFKSKTSAKQTTIWALNPLFDRSGAGATTAIGEHSFSVGVEEWSHYDIYSPCAATSRSQNSASCGHFADLRTPRRPIHKYKLQPPMKFNVQCREPSPASPINIVIQSFAIQWFAIQLFVIQWFVIQWFTIQLFAIQSFEL